MSHYYVDIPWFSVESQYDLISGRYLTIGLDNEMKGLQYNWFVKGMSTGDYTPSALRRSGR